ncbi:MAG: hypothetical protein ACM35H_12450, partial [Bacteroidota bacterium]
MTSAPPPNPSAVPDDDRDDAGGSTLLDRLSFAGFVVAVLALTFLAGAVVMVTDVYPAQAIKDAYRGGQAYYHKIQASKTPLTSDFWHPERRPEAGVTLASDEAAPGYTLYTSGHGTE